MPPHKPHDKSDAGRPIARVDDTLLENNHMREEIGQRVASFRAETMTIDQTRELASFVQGQGAVAVRALLDCLFDERANVARVALMTLSEMKEPEVHERVCELLMRPNLPERVRVSLLAVKALQEEGSSPDGLQAPRPELSLDMLLDVAESFWESMEMEEIGMMWLDNFAKEPPEDRLLMLEALTSTANAKLLAAIRVEIALGDPTILPLLAEKLGTFPGPLAPRLLEGLLSHNDLVVRTSAEESLVQCRERAAAAAAAPHRFYRAYVATDDWASHYSLAYAVKTAQQEIKFFVVLLDRWDRGVVDCWGNVHYTRDQFEELLQNMAEDFGDLEHHRISKRTALTLLDKAIALNARRKHSLPLPFQIWRHLFEEEPFREDRNVPPFGIDCTVCRKPVRTGPRMAAPWVLNGLVVCHKCSKRSLRCPECGGPATLVECVVGYEPDGDQIDLQCPHCLESFQLQQ